MYSERRWSIRKPFKIQATVTYPPLGKLHTKTQNVGLEGVFLDWPAPQPPTGAMMELTLHIAADDQQAPRLLASVVHVRADGLGLMFREFNLGLFRWLHDRLYGEMTVGHAVTATPLPLSPRLVLGPLNSPRGA